MGFKWHTYLGAPFSNTYLKLFSLNFLYWISFRRSEGIEDTSRTCMLLILCKRIPLKSCSPRNLTSGRNNGKINGPLEGYSARQCVLEDLQRCANWRWLTNGSDHNRNNNFSTWSDNVLLFPCSNSFAESFVICLRNKAHVYLLKLLTYNSVNMAFSSWAEKSRS